MSFIQHLSIGIPSDFTVSEAAWIEPRAVATFASAARGSGHSARSHTPGLDLRHSRQDLMKLG